MKSLIELVIGIVIIWFVFSVIGNFGKYEGQTAEEWFNEYDQSEADLEESQTALEEANNTIENYKTALSEANDNIDESNSKIRTAKNCSWGCSYGEMQDTLDNLKIADTVSEP